MKICFFSGYFNRNDLKSKSQGGAEYQNYLLKKELEKLNHQIYFISVGDRNEVYRDGNTIIVYLKKKSFSRKFGDNFFLYLPKVKNLINRIKPDVIYQRVSFSWCYIASNYAIKKNKKFIWAIGSEEDVQKFTISSIKNLMFNYIDFQFSKIGKKRASVIISQAEYQKNLLKTNYGRTSDITIRNYHEKPLYPLIKTKEKLIIVWIANLSINKQPEKFIEIAEFFQNYEHLQFLMIGRPFQNKYQKQIDERVSKVKNLKYLGSQAQENINKILTTSHIVINTSVIEGFSNVFIQGMLRGNIIISLNSNPDSVLHKYNCGFCANGDFKVILEHIDNLYRNLDKRLIMSENARKYSAKYHLIENQMIKILPFFR